MDDIQEVIESLLRRVRDLEDRLLSMESNPYGGRRDGYGRGKIFTISKRMTRLHLGWAPAPDSTVDVTLNGIPQLEGEDFEIRRGTYGHTIKWKTLDLREGDVVDVQEKWW